jgi:hypothetical protein
MLDVSLQFPLRGSGIYKSWRDTALPLLVLVRANVDRLRSLSITCDWTYETPVQINPCWEQIFCELPEFAPVLEELTLDFEDERRNPVNQFQIDEALSMPIFPFGAPNLRRLKFWTSFPDITSPMLESVTHLEVCDLNWLGELNPVSGLFNTLRRMSSLTSLWIHAVPLDVEHSTTVDLPSVKELTLECDNVLFEPEPTDPDYDPDQPNTDEPDFLNRPDGLFFAFRCPNLETLSLRHWTSPKLRRAFEVVRGEHFFDGVRTLEIVAERLGDVWTVDTASIFPGVINLRIFASNAMSAALPINPSDIRHFLKHYTRPVEVEYMPNLRVLTLGPYFEGKENLSLLRFRHRHGLECAVKELCYFLKRRESYGNKMSMVTLHVPELDGGLREQISKWYKRVETGSRALVEQME